MALETGNFIDDLVASNPLGTDDQSLGDDHIRLIKTLLKATFKGATRAFQFSAAGAVKVSAYTITLTDENALIRGNVSSGDFTFTLPLGSTVFTGYKVTAMKSDSSTNTLTVDGSGEETINGVASDTLTVQYAATAYMWDGSEWKIIGFGIVTKLDAALNTNSFAINESKGAAVIADTTTDIFGGDDGNTLHITGDTQIDDFTDASSAGQWRRLIFDGTPQITSGSGITVFGGTRTAVAGDMLMVFADTVSAFDAYWVLADGTAATAGMSKMHFAGLTLSNDTDSDHDINITVGECRNIDDDADMTLATTLTKRIDATWVTGDDNGGLATDLTSVAVDTWYHVFLTRKGTIIDAGFDTSITGANLKATDAIDSVRYLGSVLTDSSANIIAFIQIGIEILWDTVAEDVSFTMSTSAANHTLSVPPDISVRAKINFVSSTAGSVTGRIYSPLQTDVAVSVSNANINSSVASERPHWAGYITTNTAKQIRSRSSGNLNGARISTEGWQIDRSII